MHTYIPAKEGSGCCSLLGVPLLLLLLLLLRSCIDTALDLNSK
jgi:hypothetical protein